MDYGGPFLVKEHRRRNARATKVYLAWFICMSVKAVHLEIVTDLSTDDFLAALDRFVTRRGIQSNLYSDCGTNYVGAVRRMKTLFVTPRPNTVYHRISLVHGTSIRLPRHISAAFERPASRASSFILNMLSDYKC